MKLSKTVKREIEVAFSKHAQPIWFRIFKYTFLACILYIFWGSKWLWISLLIIFTLGILLHFWFRHKTNGWTKSYSLWKYDKNRPASEKE